MFEPNCLPTAIGSLPHKNAEEALALVLKYFPEIPFWPQLPARNPLENMYFQFFALFPGVILQVDGQDISILVDRREANFSQKLEALYQKYIGQDVQGYSLDVERAAGLKALLAHAAELNPQAIKGQITGPISLGLQITDQDRRPILYDEVLADALIRHLHLAAMAQERELRQISGQTIIFVDEPYLASFGSAFIALGREQVVAYLGEVLSGLEGLKGIHCCGNTDWSILLETPVDILSFDAYNFSESISLYPQELREFLSRGGIIAWGIAPTSAEEIEAATAENLTERLISGMNLLVAKGFDLERLVRQALITPSCGLRGVSEEQAEKAYALTRGVSDQMRKRYLGLSPSGAPAAASRPNVPGEGH